ncbi:hypothetical protein SDRG_06600 [Saprolegnia diclina VS20]|uniref:Uncharacterized protein n=1 Tax=Saprolegnia diclina (strain VS20) TaxID=1156394 RepID=T0QD74_SAPDV|nr:hypothetical protein SDRG_06600 [Saprolegnia diclina VS20]EQC35849.1 hypothetical protein SDRG_06600 [Saprolegnia diclina VS20]|eukprot:XP_008610611.1 hypothetical protein SDRG_06600 [Saprolegnia diclina VS20]
MTESALTQQLVLLLQDIHLPNTTAWQKRTTVVHEWLHENAAAGNLLDDGMEDTILRQLQRGDLYPSAQARCWRHIVGELVEVPCVRNFEADAPEPSPSRGKIRAGKDLVVLTDAVPPLEIDGTIASPLALESELPLSQRSSSQPPPSSMQKEKTFSTMSMMERQAEWLKKKQEKVEAEERRQREEKEKELTFKPNLMRRQTYTERPPEVTKPPSVTKQSSFNDKILQRTAAETRPGSRSIEKPKSSAPSIPKAKSVRRKKSIASTTRPIDAKLEVTSDLLNNMKSELKASKAMKLEAATAPADDACDDNDGDDDDDEPAEDPREMTNADDDENRLPLVLSASKTSLLDFKIDFSGGENKARLVLQDASLFELNSMYRKTDKGARREGIALQMGRREDNHEEQVVAVIFDKEKMTEAEAQLWWTEHKPRFLEPTNNPSSAT